MENWLRWEALKIPEGKYELIKLEQNFDGVYIILDDEINRIAISFEPGVLAIRTSDEGDRWRTISEVVSRNSGDYFVGKPIYVVRNSEFRHWYDKESFSTKGNYTHYAIITGNDVVDILAMVEPKVEVEKMEINV